MVSAFVGDCGDRFDDLWVDYATVKVRPGSTRLGKS